MVQAFLFIWVFVLIDEFLLKGLYFDVFFKSKQTYYRGHLLCCFVERNVLYEIDFSVG